MLGLGLGMQLGAAHGAAWSPLNLSPLAWYRGDVGSVTSWTDQSGNGNDITNVGTITTTTLGGQPAFSFAGGAYFQNASTNLVTAGAAFTLLVVAKALDATGGAIFAVRTTDVYLSLDILTAAGTSYVFGNSTVNESLASSIATEAQTAFLAEWDVPGSATSMPFRLNRSNRTLTAGFSRPTESGTTGFVVGYNNGAANQPWNGVIAELVVVTGALSSPNQTLWEAYVSARYGI